MLEAAETQINVAAGKDVFDFTIEATNYNKFRDKDYNEERAKAKQLV